MAEQKPAGWKYGPLLILTLAVLGLAWAGTVISKQHALKSWPKTHATVETYEPNIRSGEDQGGTFQFAFPYVEYHYEVNGKTYHSHALNPSPFNYQNREDLMRDTAGFAPGAQIPCWYDPADPAQAYVVNTGVTDGPVVLFLACLFLLCVPVNAFFKWRKRARQETTTQLEKPCRS